ncbi:MAG TPA: hypothetical protein VJP83_06065 [Terriglobales bacterium]|nr:hypothetical protein [Terriglobales bacterium]
MTRKQSTVALLLFLLIPGVSLLGGILFSAINPEIAAGHPNYVRNFHLLTLLRTTVFLGSLAVAGVLWLVVCFLVIRSKQRSLWWMVLALFGPLGLAVLVMLNDETAVEPDRYARFVGTLRWPVRAAWELCAFVVIWELAYEAMVLHRNLMIRLEAARTGVSTAQIIDIQNASSGMWAFGEGLEVIYLAAFFYLLWPVAFRMGGHLLARMQTPRAS